MNYYEKKRKCCAFFNTLMQRTNADYEVLRSCNKDISAYLIPKGTQHEVTYYGKPELSFRMSDHWNWFSNIKKCRKEDVIQCYCVSLPFPNKRNAPGKASDPIKAVCVAFYYQKTYYSIYGDMYDSKENSWKWIDTKPAEIVELIKSARFSQLCEISSKISNPNSDEVS